MRYGIPYQGSKNSISKEIVSFLPPGDVLIDLFAGGCAITHAALEMCDSLAPKWGRIVANDINPMPLMLFDDAVHGRLKDEKRWISREDFARLKDADAYVRYCWSFGNSGINYLYSQEIEPWKRALHMARVWGDTRGLQEMGIDSDGSRADIRAHHEEYKDKYIRWWLSKQTYTPQPLDELIASTSADVERDEEHLRAYLRAALVDSGLTQADVQRRLGTQMAGHYFGRSQWEFPTQEMYERMQTFMPALTEDYNQIIGLYRLRKSLQSLQSLERLESLESLESLQSLERLESLESLERLERLMINVGSYDSVPIPEGAVVYCDIPYQGTACKAYDGFDHAAFFDWAAAQRVPVYIRSYKIEDERFVCVWERQKRCLLQAGGGGALKTERIYTQKR